MEHQIHAGLIKHLRFEFKVKKGSHTSCIFLKWQNIKDMKNLPKARLRKILKVQISLKINNIDVNKISEVA